MGFDSGDTEGPEGRVACQVTPLTRFLQGHGDISGGCRCNVNGERCHQLCQNCH